MFYMQEEIERADVEIDGLTYRVILTPDTDTHPSEADCYSDADKISWQNDAWRFVSVWVVPLMGGEPIESAGVDLSGVEYGDLPDVPYIDLASIIESHVRPDLAGMAKDKLIEVRAAIIGDLQGLG